MKDIRNNPWKVSNEETCFDIIRHRHAGSISGYFELFEIINPPTDTCGIVINSFNTTEGFVFYEFPTLADALENFDSFPSLATMGYIWKPRKNPASRIVPCGELKPWFLAKDFLYIEGDFVFPENFMKTDATFPGGKKFLEIIPESGHIYPRVVYGTRSIDERTKEVIWNNGTKVQLSKNDELLFLPYELPEWKGELFLKWLYFINGSKRNFKYQSEIFGTLYFGIDEEDRNQDSDEEVREETELYLPDFVAFERTVEVYPGDPVDEKPRFFSSQAYIDPHNSFVNFTSFADVLLYFFSKLRCICPEKCDCQNPPPLDWDGESGTYHVSNYCPVHNENPPEVPECPRHGAIGEAKRFAFWIDNAIH